MKFVVFASLWARKLTDDTEQATRNCCGSDCAKNDQSKETTCISTSITLEKGLYGIHYHSK